MSAAVKTIKVNYESRYYIHPTAKDSRISVSTVTRLVCDKSGPLTWWAAGEAMDFCRDLGADLYAESFGRRSDGDQRDPRGSWRDWWDQQVNARLGRQRPHQLAMKAAANIGNEAHAMIQHVLADELGIGGGPEPEISEPAQNAYIAWDDWRKRVDLVPLFCERVVFHSRPNYAGRLDHAGRIGETCVLFDWKTGKAVYPEAKLQLAGYWGAAVAEGILPETAKAMIVRLPKVPGDPRAEVVEVPEIASLAKLFRAAVPLAYWLDEQESKRKERAA